MTGEPFALLFAAALVVVGLFGVLALLRSLLFIVRLLATGLSDVRDVGPEPVATVGEVEAADETVRAPLTKAECVGYVVQREVKHRRANNLFNWIISDWRTKDTYLELAPMYLADDGGRVRVEFTARGGSSTTPNSAGSNLQIGAVSEAEYDGHESAPAAVRETLGPVSDVERSVADAGVDAGPHRYTEWRIEPGDRYYALGHGDDSGREPVVRTSIDRDALVDLDANSVPRLLGYLALRLLTGVAIAAVGFGGAYLLWSAA